MAVLHSFILLSSLAWSYEISCCFLCMHELMTWKSCAMGMCSAILRNHLISIFKNSWLPIVCMWQAYYSAWLVSGRMHKLFSLYFCKTRGELSGTHGSVATIVLLTRFQRRILCHLLLCILSSIKLIILFSKEICDKMFFVSKL